MHLHAVRIVPGPPRIHAQQDVLDVRVAGAEIVSIVRCDQRQTHFVREVHGLLKRQSLDLNPRVLDLHVEPVAERLDVPLGQLPSLVKLVRQQVFRQLA